MLSHYIDVVSCSLLYVYCKYFHFHTYNFLAAADRDMEPFTFDDKQLSFLSDKHRGVFEKHLVLVSSHRNITLE